MSKTYKISIAEIEVEVVKKAIKNIHLSVYPPNGRVRIAAPVKMEEESIRLFAISRLNWIKKQRKEVLGQEREAPRDYVTGETHYYKGATYLLEVIERDSPPGVVLRNKKYMVLYVRPGATAEKREQVLKDWYRRQMKAEIPALLQKWEARISVKAADWGIKQMRTKWGSCNIEAERIWLNLELAKKPAVCLEYIIVHELVHLLERNHNARFIALMDRFMPNWRRYKEELNRLPVRHEDWEY
jgi:predicted metal-dependent hydrolase